jgi:hypothetical protein
MSAYACGKTDEWFEEIAAPQCHFQGSIFVTFNARAFLEGKPIYVLIELTLR